MSKKNLNKQEQAALELADWKRGIENCLTHVYKQVLSIQYAGSSEEALMQAATERLAKVMADSTQAAIDAERERQEEVAFKQKLATMTTRLQQYVDNDKMRLAVISETDFETYLVDKWNYLLDMQGEGEEVDERLQTIPYIAQPTTTYEKVMERHKELKDSLSLHPVSVEEVEGAANAEYQYQVGKLEILRGERKEVYTGKAAEQQYSAIVREDTCQRIDAEIDERIFSHEQEYMKKVETAKNAVAKRERDLEELKALQKYLSANLETMFV